MEFRILGPLQVWSPGGRVAIGGRQPAKVLAALLLDAGRPVGVDALIAAAWDGMPPATARHQVHKVVAGLRQRLPGAIETDGAAYRVTPDDLDWRRFLELAAAGTTTDLAAALALWRGPAFADVDSRAVRAAAAVLDESRLAAVERLADLRLAAGDAAAAVAGLVAAARENPLREPLAVRLLVALDAMGRRADALALFARTRTTLADELGVDPGPELAAAHLSLLRARPATPAIHATLPHDVPDFRGRTADLDRLRTAAVITTIDGMAGVGKTALAVHAAHRLAADHPDGQLFCDLRAHTPGGRPLGPEAALALLLRMLGGRPDDIPDGLPARAARWRAELAGRRVLVVLDNAADTGQVRPLLPGAPGCRVIVTSRRRLYGLDGATVLSLDVLPAADALALFATIVGRSRALAEPLAARRVVERCGRLPLAVRVAGARLVHRPMWTVTDLARRLDAAPLGELGRVERAFALSADCLDPGRRRLFGLLGHHPGADFDVASAAALAGVEPAAAEPMLESLVDLHLLTQPAAGRYSFHDLLRAHARSVAGRPDEAAAARLHDHFLAAATVACGAIADGSGAAEAALAWLDASRAALVAAVSGTPDWRLAAVLRVYFEHRGHFDDWLTTTGHALRHATPDGAARLRLGLAARAMWTGRLAEGMAHCHAVLAGADAEPGVRAAALTNLGMLAHLRGRDGEAAGFLRRALAIDHDLSRITALGLNNLALTEGRTGRPGAAMSGHRKALALARRAGSPAAERGILLGIGETSLRIGAPAAEPFRQARDLARAGRFRMQEALALDGIAHATGDRSAWAAALTIFAELGVPRTELVRAHLDAPGRTHCDLCPPARV